MVKDYGHVLRNDVAYAAKAQRISELTKDLSEMLPELVSALKPKIDASKLAQAGQQVFHPPCTLQHGQQLKGGVEKHLGDLGFAVQTAAVEPHLCCGSAGTYSVLNPDMAYSLLDRKLGHLQASQPSGIVSANVGCITHLQSGTATPVQHWVEMLDGVLTQEA